MIQDTSISRHFAHLPDPRIDRGKRHKLMDIITIAICATISNADGWEDIAAYGRAKETLLRTFLELPNGIPSHDTFERVFRCLDPQAFQQGFFDWIEHIRVKLPQDVVPIDGKTLCGSRDAMIDLKPIHMVSAWSSANTLVLGQCRTSEKSNEITAIPILLALLDIEDCIITIDAMGCQTAIVDQIIAKQADYVIACKRNQGYLYEDIQHLFAHLCAAPQNETDLTYDKTIHEQHGRREIRECWSTAQLDMLRTQESWTGLQSVACVRSERQTVKGTTIETRYYISSLHNNAQDMAKVIRTHWRIENQLHWVLDVVFHEDAHRTRSGNAAQNLAIIRHITLNMLNEETSIKKSVRQKRLRAGWDDNYMLNVIRADQTKVEQM